MGRIFQSSAIANYATFRINFGKKDNFDKNYWLILFTGDT